MAAENDNAPPPEPEPPQDHIVNTDNMMENTSIPPSVIRREEPQRDHHPLCSEGEMRGDQRMECDCDQARSDPDIEARFAELISGELEHYAQKIAKRVLRKALGGKSPESGVVTSDLRDHPGSGIERK